MINSQYCRGLLSIISHNKLDTILYRESIQADGQIMRLNQFPIDIQED